MKKLLIGLILVSFSAWAIIQSAGNTTSSTDKNVTSSYDSTLNKRALDVNALVPKDQNLEVLIGNVPGHSMYTIVGHDEVLTTTRTTISPASTTQQIDQSALFATPAVVECASADANDTSAGTGLRTMLLVGQDSAGAAQQETITLNGQTEVASVNTYRAVFSIRGLTAGSGNKNAGVVYCGSGTFTSGVPAVRFLSMDVSYNKSLTAFYVVPTGYTFTPRQFIVNMSSSSKDLEIFIETSSDGVFWVTEASFGLESGDSLVVPVKALPPFAAGTFVRIEAESSASGTDVTVFLAGEVIAN